MLLILYGVLSRMGYNVREHLKKSGFQLITKFNMAVSPILTSQFGSRTFVSEEEFLENTDSLFRYEIGGIKIGFNQQQISDAVCDKANCLLTVSAKDISFLAEIKRVYADKVRLIYTYIDDNTLKDIIGQLDITEEEAKTRYEIGCNIKQGYLQYQHIFDHILIYGGENSGFNSESLYRQLDCIIGASAEPVCEGDIQHADIFVSYTRKDEDIYRQIRSALEQKGLSVFDASQLSPDVCLTEGIKSAIQKAKIFIPVITENALNSTWVMVETQIAIEQAEMSGALIIPMFDKRVDLEKAPELRNRLATRSCTFIEDEKTEEAARNIAHRIQKLLSAETYLKSYAKKVENYLYLKMYEEAREVQEAHLDLCDEVFAKTNGTFISIEACLLSRIKLISILLDMNLYEEALGWSIDALNLQCDDSGDNYDVLIDQFCICCAYMKMDADKVRNLATDRFIEFTLYDPEYKGKDRWQLHKHAQMEWLMGRFRNAVTIVESYQKQDSAETDQSADDESLIAEHGESAIALFEEILRSRSISRQDLILGYERVLNYCKHVGLRGSVADKCISRIAELGEMKGAEEVVEHSTETEALKIYLGQALPQSGEYDVFLSYKSEDEALATKIYDHLSQSGKEVFFAKKTLPQLGESQYTTMIFDAIDHSRHMVLIGSNPDYLKTSWVSDEWSTFRNEIREGRKTGNLILVLTDDVVGDKGRLPPQLRQVEIVKMSEFRNRLLSYLR